MEFDSLRAVAHSVNSGMDYVSGNTATAIEGKGEIGASKGLKLEQTQDLKAIGKETVEFLKSELKELNDSISSEFFDKFVQEANKKLFSTGRQFSYTLHEATNRVAIKVIDSRTKEVIREVPPEKALDAAAKMMELVGVIFDKKI